MQAQATTPMESGHRITGPAQTPPSDAEHLRERLHNLRTIVPVFAEELASARRQAAGLRRENGRLLERIREMQRPSRARR